MSILALDLGTTTGWALWHNDHMTSGTWTFKNSRFEGGGMRFLRFERCLTGFWDGEGEGLDKLSEIVFEEVRRHRGTAAAHAYGGFLATLTRWCEFCGIPYRAIPVGTIKKVATGKGNAGKPAMIAAAQAKWPEADITDDNEADARWILMAALAEFEPKEVTG